MEYKCEFCEDSFSKAQGFNSHVRQRHSELISDTRAYMERYYLEFIDSSAKQCSGCGVDRKRKFQSLSKGYGDSLCRTCAQKNNWKLNPERKKYLSMTMGGNTRNPSGRPKGSKNKNRYPIESAAVQERIKNHQGPHHWKTDPQIVYEKRANTLRARSDDDIKSMLNKQINTMIKNKTAFKYRQGKFIPKNPKKYMGDATNIVYRSGWERDAFKWLDEKEDIVKWVSEEVVIPYTCATDNRKHRYFIDLFFETKSKHKYLIEIKPKNQTEVPKKKQGKRYLTEMTTFIKNQSKWKAATEFAKDNGAVFQVWTEDTLHDLGIRNNKGFKKLKPLPKPKKRKK